VLIFLNEEYLCYFHSHMGAASKQICRCRKKYCNYGLSLLKQKMGPKTLLF